MFTPHQPTTSVPAVPGSDSTAAPLCNATGGRSMAATWTRRGFLGALAAVAVGYAVSSGSRMTGANLLGGAPPPLGPFGSPSPSSGPNLVPPFALTANCELSEDYFLVTNHQLGATATDRVVAYSRADGEVEAIVLQDGGVRQMYRDPSQAGGWNVVALPDAASVVSMVAGMSGPVQTGPQNRTAAVLKVFYTTVKAADTLFVATETEPATSGGEPTWVTTSIPWTTQLAPLQIAVNFDSSLLVTAMMPSSSKTASDGKLFYYADGLTVDPGGQPPTPTYGFATGFSFAGWNSPLAYAEGAGLGWSAIVAAPQGPHQSGGPTLLLALPAGSYGPLPPPNQNIGFPSVLLWGWNLRSGQQRSDADPVPGGWLLPAPPPTAQTYAYSVEAMSVQGGRKSPALVVRTIDTDNITQHLWLLSPNDQTRGWRWTELGLPEGLKPADPVVVTTATRPAPSSEKNAGGSNIASFLDVFVVAGETLHVIRQSPQGDAAKDSTSPAYCPLIPLQPEVAYVTSQAGDSTGNELLVVSTDGTLESLVKDPSTGHWADAPVHLPSSELQQVSSYRVELTVTDSWNQGVAARPVRVTSSTPVTALVNGQALPIGASPTTIVTDGQGSVMLALIADGLSSPTLTLDVDGVPSATVNPSAPVNTYLQGGTPLNYQAPLTTDTLADATTPDGEVVAPGAKNAGDASDGIDNMAQAATWAASPTLTSARRSATLSRRDGQLGGKRPGGGTNDPRGVLSDIDAWAHDALHAIKKAAVRVEKVAYDVASRTFTLAADFATWAGKAVTLVIRGIEDAAHVFHAVLNKLGAAILKAVKWLEAEVLGLLRSTAALADQYETWIGQALAQVGGHLASGKNSVDGWLTREQADLKAKFAGIAQTYPRATTLTTMPTRSSVSARWAAGAPPAGRPGRSGSDDPSTTTPHSNWLFNKIKNELTGSLIVTTVTGADALFAGFGEAAAAALGDFRTAFADLLKFLTDIVKHPEDAGSVGVHDLLNVLNAMIDGVFTFVRGVVDTALSLFVELAGTIPAMLQTPLSEALGIVGKLLGLIGLGNVTIGKLVAMLFAFPTVLAYKIVHGSQTAPFALTGAEGGLSARNAAGDLQICAGSALGIWAAFDTLSAGFTAGGEDGPMIFTAIDLAAPVLVGILTVPGTSGGEPFTSPPVGADNKSQMDFAAWILGIIPSFSVAAALYIDKVLGTAPGKQGWKESLLWLTAGCGIGALVTGCVGTALDDAPNPADYAGAVLNNMANIIAPCLEDEFVKSTEGGSAVVACALTLTCGLIGAVVYGVDG